MSTEELRQELARIGDRAPVVDVPDGTFGRAQRARRRDRLAVIGAIAVVVAIAGGLVAWLPDRSGPQPADSGGLGVPDVIYSVPGDMLTTTDDLAVGLAAAVLMSDDNLPVVIDAADGTYRALNLPGFGERQRDQGSALSLSPDGRQLAWGWSKTQKVKSPSGVRIVDLMTGEQRSITVPSATGTFVFQIGWSRDSRWLVWWGAESVGVGRRGWGAGDPIAGRIGPVATSSEPLPQPGDDTTALAIGDDGTVVIADLAKLTWWDGEVLETRARSSNWYPAVVTPEDGELLEIRQRGDDIDNFRTDYRLVTAEGSVPAPALAQIALLPLGLLDDAVVVASTLAIGDETRHLSLMDVKAGGTLRDVGVIEGRNATVAVDLMTDAEPTVDRPEPPWVEDDDDGFDGAKVAIVVGILGVLGVLARLWLRRRQANAK
jgi:hypothetical protein